MNIYKCKRSDKSTVILAFVCFMLGLLILNAEYDFAEEIKKIFQFISIALLTIIILRHIPSLKKTTSLTCYLFYILLLSFSIVNQDYYFLAVLLFAVSFSIIKIDEREIFHISFLLISISTIFCVIFFKNRIGFHDPRHTIVDFYRQTLGFKWPLVIQNIVTYLCIFYFSYQKKFLLSKFFLFELIAFILFLFTDARNGLIALQLLGIMYFIVSLCYSRFIMNLLKIIAYLTVPFCFILSLYTLNIYMNNSKYGSFFNELLSGRLFLMKLNISIEPYHLLSFYSYNQFLEIYPYTVDSGYFYILFRYGIIFAFALSFFCFFIVKQLVNSHNSLGLVGAITLFLMNLIDNSFISFSFFSFFCIGILGLKNFVNGKK